MCGIAGCFGINKGIDKEIFEKAVDLVEYRGPNDRGTYYNDNIALGQRRLSIIDTSIDGHQPFMYLNRYIIVFNGEIYNYIELREDLIKQGYQFRSQTDTEVLVALYDCYGEQCLTMCNGMWAFIIYDIQKDECFISRDRFGVKPLYYYHDDNQTVFGSEIKQVITILGKSYKPKANRQRLLEFLMYDDIDYTDETLFDKIKQVMPGHFMLYHQGSLKDSEYYNLDERVKLSKKALGSYDQECAKYAETFRNSVEIRLRSDVPVGYFLSGGLDSSAIVCQADKICKDRAYSENKDSITPITISSCSTDSEYDEQEYADSVINQTKATAYKLYPVLDNIFDELDDMVWHADEPFASTSSYASWNVCRTAKEKGLTVILDGQGADEQLAGYSNFYSVLFVDLIKKFRFIKLSRELKAYKGLRASTEKYVSYKDIVTIPLLSALMPNFIRNKVRVYINKKNQNKPFSIEDYKRTLSKRNIYSFRNAQQFTLDSMKNGLRTQLHYDDRESMSFSLETRLPFLDYRLVEQVCAMPITYKIRNGMTKAVARDALKNVIPDKIRNRSSKLGYVTPEDKWMNENKDRIREELLCGCNKLEGIVDTNRIMNWYDKNNGEIERGDSLVWKIICTGRWVSVFNVKI